MRAKPMAMLVADALVRSKLLLDTLEGAEPLGADSVFCIGEGGDAWQQSSEKMFQKYDVASIDIEGWMVCNPKPENRVDYFEVQPQHLEQATERDRGVVGYFVQGMWGATHAGIANLQSVRLGDFVARNPTDLRDQWVVQRNIWLRSYSEVEL